MAARLLAATILSVAIAGCAGDDQQDVHPTATVAAPTATPATPAPTPLPLNSDLGAAVNGGGCYPTKLVLENPLDMLFLINPEWSPVVNGTGVDSEPVLVHGTILGGHGDNGGDFPSSHIRSDQNTFVRVDPQDFNRVATGNDLNQGDLELAIEWEVGAYPDWAWGSAGDRIVALGRWIFDCGHPGSRAGHCSVTADRGCVMDSECRAGDCPECVGDETCEGEHFGYSSEIHPPYATAVIRRGRGGLVSTADAARPIAATRADIFVSPFGGGAGDRCVVTHLANPLTQLKTNCYPLKEPLAQAHLNDRDFAFDVPLPPSNGTGHAVWRFESRDTPGGVPPAVEVVPFESAPEPHLHVTVRMTQPTSQGLPTGYAATMFAGWEDDHTPLTHVRVTVQSVVIHNPLQPNPPAVPRLCSGSRMPCMTAEDCAEGDGCYGVGPVKRWRLQAAVNGEWRELEGLQSVDAGAVIPENIAFDQYLPDGAAVQIVANGDSEDCINSIFGQGLKVSVEQLGFTDGLTCLLSSPHNPGEVNVTYSDGGFGTGGGAAEYETRSTGGEGGTCSDSGAPCVSSVECPNGATCNITGGAFSLRYRIERLS